MTLVSKQFEERLDVNLEICMIHSSVFQCSHSPCRQVKWRLSKSHSSIYHLDAGCSKLQTIHASLAKRNKLIYNLLLSIVSAQWQLPITRLGARLEGCQKQNVDNIQLSILCEIIHVYKLTLALHRSRWVSPP